MAVVDQAISEGVSLLSEPAELFLDPSELRLRLADDGRQAHGVVQHEVDDTATGPWDRYLESRFPSRMQLVEERLDHRYLKSIMDARSGARIEPKAEIRSERHADRCQGFEARLDLGCFDPRKVRWIQTRYGADFAQRYASIQPQVMDIFAGANRLPPHSTGGLPGDGRPADHLLMKPGGPQPLVAWKLTVNPCRGAQAPGSAASTRWR